MQEFLSGKAFEEMAREYNAKYNRANVLDKSFENEKKYCDNLRKEEVEEKFGCFDDGIGLSKEETLSFGKNNNSFSLFQEKKRIFAS